MHLNCAISSHLTGAFTWWNGAEIWCLGSTVILFVFFCSSEGRCSQKIRALIMSWNKTAINRPTYCTCIVQRSRLSGWIVWLPLMEFSYDNHNNLFHKCSFMNCEIVFEWGFFYRFNWGQHVFGCIQRMMKNIHVASLWCSFESIAYLIYNEIKKYNVKNESMCALIVSFCSCFSAVTYLMPCSLSPTLQGK